MNLKGPHIDKLAQLLVAFIDLLEAEGALLRRRIIGLAVVLAIVVVCFLLSVVGLGFVVWSIYLFAAQAWGPPAGALATGLAVLALMLIFGLAAKGIDK